MQSILQNILYAKVEKRCVYWASLRYFTGDNDRWLAISSNSTWPMIVQLSEDRHLLLRHSISQQCNSADLSTDSAATRMSMNMLVVGLWKVKWWPNTCVMVKIWSPHPRPPWNSGCSSQVCSSSMLYNLANKYYYNIGFRKFDKKSHPSHIHVPIPVPNQSFTWNK